MTIGRYLAIIGLVGLASCQSAPYRDSTYTDNESKGVAEQTNDLRERGVGALSDSRQNLRRRRRASIEAEEIDEQVKDLTTYRVVGELGLKKVVTANDQGDNKGEYLSLKTVEGAEIIELIYGGKKKHFNISDLDNEGQNVRVYLKEDLGVRRLSDGVEVVFYGKQTRSHESEQPNAAPIAPLAPTSEQEHSEAMQRIEDARTESRNAFEEKMRGFAENILGININFLRRTELAVAGYAQRRNDKLDRSATEITTEIVGRYQTDVEETRDNVERLFDEVEQAKGNDETNARLKQRLEKLRAQRLAPKEN